MIAFVTLLDPDKNKLSQELWNRLGVQCDLTGIKLPALTHFSWHVANEYTEQMETELASLITQVEPFTIHTVGLGLFTGPAPVLYLPIVKTRKLEQIHRRVWELLTPYCVGPNLLYQPDRWVPHITIAYKNVSQDTILCSLKDLIHIPLQMEFLADNFSVIFESEQNLGLRSKKLFAKGG
jgi:2'-5' RNA ligase